MKRVISLFIICMMLISATACTDKNVSDESTAVTGETVAEDNTNVEEPSLSQIRSICKLATLECYYHNVAKSVKEKGTGLSHIGETDRRFWTSYSGVVKMGVDMSRGSINLDGSVVTVYMPEAEILSITIDEDSIESPISESDKINKNEITAEDTTSAINTAQEDIREAIQNDSTLLADAQDRAKRLIKNYIDQLGDASGVKYTIRWETINNN